ncbi:glycosyltransferase [Bacteroidota bacterium]
MGKIKKILLVSIPSIHFIRWINQLDDPNIRLYFYNIRNIERTRELPSNCEEITIKSNRPFRGEGFIKKRSSIMYQMIDDCISVFYKSSFEKILNEIKPDAVHAFELNTSAYPILSVMNRHKKIPFVYSIWGSDIYFFQNLKTHKFKIPSVLKRVNYLFTDCNRDFILAKKYNFKGRFLGKYPGGGGYDIVSNKVSPYLDKKNRILIKGYEHQFGRSINVLKSLLNIKEEIKHYEIVFFSAQDKLVKYYNSDERFKELNLKFLLKSKSVNNKTMLKLFDSSKIYIGNSISDGMPNTLLEALLMGVFPIQSNPGGATAEVITDGENGFLINDPNDVCAISNLIKKAVENEDLIKKAYQFNSEKFRKELEIEFIRNEVLNSYKGIFIE